MLAQVRQGSNSSSICFLLCFIIVNNNGELYFCQFYFSWFMLKVKIQKTDLEIKTPTYAHAGDAGMDLYAAENIIIKPGERKVVATGVKMEIPAGYVGLIWDKSGLASKNGLKTMGGVIDSTYRGEVGVVVMNLGDREYRVEKNAKIAQMLIQRIENIEIEEVNNLENSSRGEGGFGSSGMR